MDWPRVRPVVLFDNTGVASSAARPRIPWKRRPMTPLRSSTRGLARVDVLGLLLGGYVAQALRSATASWSAGSFLAVPNPVPATTRTAIPM